MLWQKTTITVCVAGGAGDVLLLSLSCRRTPLRTTGCCVCGVLENWLSYLAAQRMWALVATFLTPGHRRLFCGLRWG